MIARTICLAVFGFACLGVACTKNPIKTAKTTKPTPTHETVRTSTNSQRLRAWTTQLNQAQVFRIASAAVDTSTTVALTKQYPKESSFFVQIFATYCPPCLREIPSFNAIYEKGHPVVGLSLDASNHEGLSQVVLEHKPKYPMSVVSSASLENLSPILAGLPMTLLINPSGRVALIIYGVVSEKTLLKHLQKSR